MVNIFNPAGVHKPMGYSHVAEVTGAKLVYIAGQVAMDAQGNLVGKDDFAAQMRQVFENLQQSLRGAGATFQDVIKLNYFCADSVDVAAILPLVREIRDQFVNTQAPPASTFVVVRRLVRAEWLIEVEAVAAVS